MSPFVNGPTAGKKTISTGLKVEDPCGQARGPYETRLLRTTAHNCFVFWVHMLGAEIGRNYCRHFHIKMLAGGRLFDCPPRESLIDCDVRPSAANNTSTQLHWR